MPNHENASATEPAAATRPIWPYTAATTGAIGSPAQNRSTVMAPIEPAASGRAISAVRANVPTMILRRSSLDGRSPARRPPTSEPAENPARATPARARLPSASAKAGTAISTAPNPRPRKRQSSAIVRTPTAERAPSRALCRSSAGPASRTGGIRAKANVPTAASDGGTDDGGDGTDHGQDRDEERAADEDQLLQRGVERIRRPGAVAAGDRRPDRAKHRRDRRHRQPGGSSRNGDGGDRGTDLTENGDEAEEPREEHHPPPQDEPGATAIDLPATVGCADRDGDRVGGRDETGLAVARAGPPDEQHERERRHPDGQTGDDAPGEQRGGVRVGEERAVARDATRLRSGWHAQEGRSIAEGSGPGGSSIFWRR